MSLPNFYTYGYYVYGFTGLTFGNNKFFATVNMQYEKDYSYRGICIISTDGISWSAVFTPSQMGAPSAPAYGNGKFIVHSLYGSYAYAAYSTDAITWTTVSVPVQASWRKTIYANNQFMTMGTNGTGLISTDGISWTRVTLPSSNNYMDIAYGNNMYMAVDNTTRVATSTDGITWVSKTTPINAANSVMFGYDKFIVGDSNASVVYESTDGTTWTQRAVSVTVRYRSPVVFPAGTEFSNSSYVYKSLSVPANTTQSISYEVNIPKSNEMRVQSTIPLQVTVMGEA